MIHLLKHTTGDGPGALGRFLTRRGAPFRTIELAHGQSLPRISNDISAVVSLGGHMDVSEEANYPFLKEETVFINRIVQNEIPFFGICLGAQLLAKAFGADVYRGRVNERGWTPVSLPMKECGTGCLQAYQEISRYLKAIMILSISPEAGHGSRPGLKF